MITKEMILQRISQEDIIEKYFPDEFVVNRFIVNPFRRDQKPDCKFYWEGDTLLFMDFASREFSGDCFKLASIATEIDFPAILYKIDEDFELNLMPKGFHDKSKPVVNIVKNKPEIKKPKSITCEFMDFNKYDYRYWDDRGITLETLEYFNVRPCYRVWIGATREIFTYTIKNPIYAYLIKEPERYEIYRPFALRKEKFRTNCSKNTVKGWQQLPEEGSLLVITKAYKDLMNYYELGYPAISFGGETTLPEDYIIKDLMARFDNIIVNYDKDDAGISMSKFLNEKYNFPYWFIPEKYGVKDLNDFIKEYDYDSFKKEFRIEDILANSDR